MIKSTKYIPNLYILFTHYNMMLNKKSKPNKVKKVKTGVSGLDTLLGGGIPEGHTVLVSGGAGCGKTTFLCQYLNEGLKNGETCLFITLEESKKQISEDAAQFGWDFQKYEKQKKLYLKQYNPFELSGDLSLNSFEHYIEYIKATRVVIDPISLFAAFVAHEGIESVPGEYGIRRGLFFVIDRLRKANTTTMMSTEIVEGQGGKLSRYGAEEFVADGSIVLSVYESLDTRKIGVRKMRGIKHTLKSFEMEIKKDGIAVKL